MLPPETQHEIYAQIPRQLTIDWYEPVNGPDPDIHHTATVPLTVREQRSDVDYPLEAYPIVAVTFAPTTIDWGPGARLPDALERIPEEADPNIAYTEYVGERVYDQLNIIVAVADGIDVDDDGRNEIPKAVVAKELAREIYANFMLAVDHLNDPAYMSGPKQWPVVVEETRGEGISRMESMVADSPVIRYAMQFNCRYTMTKSRVVDAVDAIDYELSTETPAGEQAGSIQGSIEFEADYGDPDSV